MIDQDRELLEAWRAVANAKLVEYRRQCWRLSLLVRQGALRVERVLTNDPGTGVMRHADAGYALARETARERGLDLPRRP